MTFQKKTKPNHNPFHLLASEWGFGEFILHWELLLANGRAIFLLHNKNRLGTTRFFVCLFLSTGMIVPKTDIFSLPLLFLSPPPEDSAWRQGSLQPALPGTSAGLGCGRQTVQRGNLQVTLTPEMGGCLRKREELSPGTRPPLIDASTFTSHDTQDPRRGRRCWTPRGQRGAMGTRRALGSGELQLQPRAAVGCLHWSPKCQAQMLHRNTSSSCAYHPRAMVWSWDSLTTRLTPGSGRQGSAEGAAMGGEQYSNKHAMEMRT